MHNAKSLQPLFSQSCGDYALMFLIDRAEGLSMNNILNWFTQNSYVNNYHKVEQTLKRLIVDELVWSKLCKTL